ncbi:MAG: circularly permuted type 2 ATP-grasp protein [Nakamurella sp.]
MTATESTAAEKPGPPVLLTGYPPGPLDEAVEPDGRVRPGYSDIVSALDSVGIEGLRAATGHLDRIRVEEGISFIADIDGDLVEQPFPLDPIPRVLSAADWAGIRAGLTQRTRALNAFLADVYGSDDLSKAQIVRDAIVPESVIRNCPGYLPGAADFSPGDRPRATILGFDLLNAPSGRWVVLEDNLRVPSGLGYAVSNRRTAASALPMLHPWPDLLSPESVGSDLLSALQQAAPVGCPRTTPSVAVLSDGPENSAWYEHQLLATAMGVPVVTPTDLSGDQTGVFARVDGRLTPIDVLYRRLGDDEIIAGPAVSEEANALLRAASRAGAVSLVNTPGNGVADDKAVYAFVHTMIHYYLGEEPLIGDVGTWVLADPNQYEGVRDRLRELVVKPVDGSGGAGVMIGPDISEQEFEVMQAEVQAHPELFIAQEVIRFSSHPTLTANGLEPRHVDLRVFALAGLDGSVTVPDVALSRVAMAADGLLVNSSRGGGSKDTWLRG